MRREPGRTCLGCGRVMPKRRLVRLVRRADGAVAADPRGVRAGRGAYVCAEAGCVERALTPARLRRAFRGGCEVGPELVEEVRTLWRLRR